MNVRRIEILEPGLANKIAAGEVVERPASVVKELVENSLDAGATSVTIEIRDGGTEYIRITDNGCGITSDDVKTAFLRHATSKLYSAEGLDGIETLGFRGEALASIAAVSKVTMRTHTAQEDHGTLIRLEGGSVREFEPCGCPEGTSIEVSELFYNVPARLKFLRSARAEAAAVGDYVLRLILGNTGVSIKFINNGKPVYHSAGDSSLENALVCIYGPDISEHLKHVFYDDGYLRISGFCGDEYLAKGNRVWQSVFVNGRYIRSQQISYAVQRAYNTRLMVGRFPFFAFEIKLSPREVDVNVHPNKLTVRFRDEERITAAVTHAVREALERKGNALEEEPVPEFEPAYNVFKRDGEEKHTGLSELLEEAENERRAETAAEETKQKYEYKPANRPEYRKEEDNAAAFTEQTKPSCEPSGIVMRDSGASAPAMTETDVNGVIHYTFTKPHKESEERAEVISFDLAPYTVIGTAFDTYILVEQGDSVFCIDQHAAHERILYEKLIKNELRFESQILLTSVIVRLDPTDFSILTENIERFRELGFEIDEFGPMSVSVHAIPNGVRKENAEKLLGEMIDIVRRQGSVTELDVIRSSLIQSSCKHAIKAGQTLDEASIRNLLSHYADGSTPLTCPHGRPVMLRVSKRELEKMFKRIV